LFINFLQYYQLRVTLQECLLLLLKHDSLETNAEMFSAFDNALSGCDRREWHAHNVVDRAMYDVNGAEKQRGYWVWNYSANLPCKRHNDEN
jgi:hypothetical protein